MTTIAANRHGMAADSWATGDTRATVRKLFRHRGWLLGFAGTASTAARVVAAIRRSRKDPVGLLEDIRDSGLVKDLEDVEVLLLSPKGTLHVFDGNHYEVQDTHAAIGTGAMAALAAMHCGKTPRDAVKVAAKIDPYTGGRVLSYIRSEKP